MTSGEAALNIACADNGGNGVYNRTSEVSIYPATVKYIADKNQTYPPSDARVLGLPAKGSEAQISTKKKKIKTAQRSEPAVVNTYGIEDDSETRIRLMSRPSGRGRAALLPAWMTQQSSSVLGTIHAGHNLAANENQYARNSVNESEADEDDDEDEDFWEQLLKKRRLPDSTSTDASEFLRGIAHKLPSESREEKLSAREELPRGVTNPGFSHNVQNSRVSIPRDTDLLADLFEMP